MKKPLCLLLTGLSMLLAGTGHAQNWQLVWSDEFNGSIGPDWVFETGAGGWGNNEQEYYQQANATIENNALVITAKKENVGGAAYTSVRMKTQGKRSWKYGKMEARIAMPAFQGAWPGFWMMGDSISSVGWPACGEIDIMEHINTGTAIYGSTHWTGTNNAQADFTNSTNANSPLPNYHTYGIEWTPTTIKWFVDGVQYNQFDITNGTGGTSEFAAPFFLILNFAIGGNWPGGTVDQGAFPAKMYVDYVRVYQDGGSTTTPPPSTNGGQSYFMLVNRATGKCADLISGNTANGAPINEWTYDYNGPNQRWALIPTEGGNHFRLVSWVTGKSAGPDGDSANDGVQITDRDYSANDPYQQWDFVDAGNGWYKVRNVGSGKMLDIAYGATADNTKIQQANDNGGYAQNWRLQPQGDYYVKASTGKYICIQDKRSDNTASIVVYSGENNPWFKWRFESTDEGRYKVSSLNALSRCLCVANASTASAANCHLYDYNPNNGGDQKVRLVPLTNGKFKFYFVHDQMSWDVPGGNANNLTPLQQYPDNGNSWQQFSLERVP